MISVFSLSIDDPICEPLANEAAEWGLANAERRFRRMRHADRGVEKYDGQAMHCYSKATEQGYTNA